MGGNFSIDLRLVFCGKLCVLFPFEVVERRGPSRRFAACCIVCGESDFLASWFAVRLPVKAVLQDARHLRMQHVPGLVGEHRGWLRLLEACLPARCCRSQCRIAAIYLKSVELGYPRVLCLVSVDGRRTRRCSVRFPILHLRPRGFQAQILTLVVGLEKTRPGVLLGKDIQHCVTGEGSLSVPVLRRCRWCEDHADSVGARVLVWHVSGTCRGVVGKASTVHA